MKTLRFFILVILLFNLALPVPAWAASSPGGQRSKAQCQNLVSASLSPAEKADLMFVREEEKMARDLYISFNRLYGSQVRVFANIARAEQTHMNAIKPLLDAYGLADPVVSNPIGAFTHPDLRELYDELLLKGQASLTNAFEVGVRVEELDIGDLGKALKTSQSPCIDKVYLNLLRGSESHLRAFNRQLQ